MTAIGVAGLCGVGYGKLRETHQHQFAVRSPRLSGADTQKIVNRFLQLSGGLRCIGDSHTREVDDLLRHDFYLSSDTGLDAIALGIEHCLAGINSDADWCWPATQRVNDGPQRSQGATGSLPSIGTGDATDGASIEVRKRICAQVFDVIKRVLH